MSKSLDSKRQKLLDVARDRNANPEDIFEANLKLAKLPRNSSVVRVRNRCALSGRPRGYYRKFEVKNSSVPEAVFENAGLEDSTFTDVNFDGSTFKNCSFKNVKFENCDK